MKTLLLPYYEAIIRLKRRIVARLVVSYTKGFRPNIVTKTDESHTLVLHPKQPVEFFFSNLRRGTYQVEILHNDEMLAYDQQALVTSFAASSGLNPEALAMGLGVNNTSETAFSYMGGGTRKVGHTRQVQNIKITHALHWFRINLHSPLDRVINIEGFEVKRLVKKPKKIAAEPIKTQSDFYVAAVEAWASRCSISDNIKYIVYADINMNVVDGSSVWLSSMLSVLAGIGRTLVVAKATITSDIITSNIKNIDNITFITPSELDLSSDSFTVLQAVKILRCLDDALPNIERIFIRGLNEGFEVFSNRQFYDRAAIYLTNFYNIEDGERLTSLQTLQKTRVAVLHARYILAQTTQIATELFSLTGIKRKTLRLPPPVPNDLKRQPIHLPPTPVDTIRIGYAGKIVPLWGVDILLDWVKRLKGSGYNVETYIVANRVSDGIGRKKVPGFTAQIRRQMEDVNAVHYTNFNREKSMSLMAQMDFVWCYRPAELEDNTLELSTKLVEMISLGRPCFAYPNLINRESLGEAYPFFIKSYENFRSIMSENTSYNIDAVSKNIQKTHGLGELIKHVKKEVCKTSKQLPLSEKKILFSGHDLKFIDAYISHIKSQGALVRVDRWEWGAAKEIKHSKSKREWADVVFCEWGLANAVWHSENKMPNSRLIVRIHLQEINPRARRFGYQIDADNVDCFIFVSDQVRLEAIKLFGWAPKKTKVIPNYVLGSEYEFRTPIQRQTIVIGMVGIIPSRKRFDRAVKVLQDLISRGYDATLKIKGPRPENIAFMRAPGRVKELDYYYDIYAQIDELDGLIDRIQFENWGNDVALWYKDVDFILSPSDFESFHYALADGVLSGSWPIIWPWEEAKDIYTEDWIIENHEAAMDIIERVMKMSVKSKTKALIEHRDLILSQYGHEKIFLDLTREIF